MLADAPFAIWRKVGRYVTAPNMHTPMRKRITPTRAEGADRGTGAAGIAGSSARRSTSTNAMPSHDGDDCEPDDHRRAPRVLAAAPTM